MKAILAFIFVVMMTVSAYAGGITLSVENGDKVVSLDIDRLYKMTQHEVISETPWEKGITEFSGPLLRDVLALAGIKKGKVAAIALNDYKIELFEADYLKYDTIVAIRKNGHEMSIRQNGPFWIVFPWGKHEELRVENVYSRSVWQLGRLVAK